MKKYGSLQNIITAIDIGTTKICVLIAHQVDEHSLDIIGIGKAPSQGLARGVVVDIAQAVQSIKAALKEAELMAGITVEAAHIGISGSHIHSFNSNGMVPIRNGVIRETDITQVINVAKAVVLPEGQQLLHALPQLFTINGEHSVRDPLHMSGVRLEAQVHIITGAVASVQNLIRCCEMAGVKAQDIILEPLASADAVLSSDERELGVGMLDIGGGTSDFAIYQNGTIRHTKVFPIAGNIFTNDIAVCLRTTIKEAERIKKEFGIADASLFQQNAPLDIMMTHGDDKQTIMLSDLFAVLESRTEELLSLVRREIVQNNLQSFVHSGLVITGGGSMLHGIREQAERVLQIPVRIGKTRVTMSFQQALEHPMYATGYGLLVHALKKQRAGLSSLGGPLMNKVISRMKSWVFDFF